jgi:hypothetical protein
MTALWRSAEFAGLVPRRTPDDSVSIASPKIFPARGRGEVHGRSEREAMKLVVQHRLFLDRVVHAQGRGFGEWRAALAAQKLQRRHRR